MLLLKRLVARLLFPMPLTLEILLLGLFLLWFTRRQKAARVVLSAGVLLLALVTNSFVGRLLILPLEAEYPPVPDAAALAGAEPLKWVVALSGGYFRERDLPCTVRPNRFTIVRFVEAIRMHQQLPGSKLVVSVSHSDLDDGSDQTMLQLARTLGVDERNVVFIRGAEDTKSEARHAAEIIGADRLVLVTEASHLPRALALFRDAGMDPLPAPTDFRTKSSESSPLLSILPSARGADQTERAAYEYLGLAWRALGG